MMHLLKTVTCLLAVLLWGSLAFAQGEITGKQDFLVLCSSCHGIDGKGKGAMASTNAVKPADLTLLSQSRGGHFPYVEVRRIIDGRRDKGTNRSHFKDDMPLWGDVFVKSNNSSASTNFHEEAVAKMRILNIVDYLVTIQE